MAQDINLQSAGVTSREIDLSGPRTVQPVGIPAGIIGTSLKGPAFIPVTLADMGDFVRAFGSTDGKKFGPYAVNEWLRNATAVTFFKVLGIGDGKKRLTSGNNQGSVNRAGFVVGQELANGSTGQFAANPLANTGPLGRLYFLGCYMSESAGSTYLSDAGMTGNHAHPIIRGILMAPSGVMPTLSASTGGDNRAPDRGLAAEPTRGQITGAVNLLHNGIVKQQFVMLLNGYKGDPEREFATTLTASFDAESNNYFGTELNRDPTKIEEKGHYLYLHYDMPTAHTVVTGSGIINPVFATSGTIDTTTATLESIAFLTTGTLGRNVGSATVPSYANFEDRFATPQSPWFTSQKYGSTIYNLFRIVSRDDGDYANHNIKISISSITPSNDLNNEFGTFNVAIRDFADADNTIGDSDFPSEEYTACSMDPGSDRYIAKLIGDQHLKFNLDRNTANQKLELDGTYPNKSHLVRVELSAKSLNGEVPTDALPVGFRGPDHLITSGSDPLTTTTDKVTHVLAPFNADMLKRCVEPPVPFRDNMRVGSGLGASTNFDLYWGVQFELPDSLVTPNSSQKKNGSIAAMAKYLPNFQTANVNVTTGSNPGAADTAALGVVDADRFNNNLFTLENISVVTSSTADVADDNRADEFAYVRTGSVVEAGERRAFDVAKDLATPSTRRCFKYTTFVQGGFDGVNIFNEEASELTNTAVKAEMDNINRGLINGPTVSAYNKAITVMKNTSDVDIKLLAIPGIRNAGVTDGALEAMKDRFDALYIMDIEERDNLNAVITGSDSDQKVSVRFTVDAFKQRLLDTSFGSAYFPGCTINDELKPGVTVKVPASVPALGAYSLNDSIGKEWFAPAGVRRGRCPSALFPSVTLNQDNLDTLYTADINPLVDPTEDAIQATSPGNPVEAGVIVWGQKTLLTANTSLDRVNVRRLLINVRRQVRGIANILLFEPNRASTLARFSSLVEPRMAIVQQQQGFERFKVVIDASTTTQADVENNTIRGKIFLQPTKTAEFVSLDFVVTNAGGPV